MGGLGDVIQGLLLLLPWWAVAGALAAALVLGLPGLLHGARARQIRGLVRRMVRAEGSARDLLSSRALALAGTDAHLLALAAREARKRDQPGLHLEAMRRLDAVPGMAGLARQVRQEVAPAPPPVAHPVDAAVRARALMEDGALSAARARVEEALGRFPDDPELRELLAAITDREAAG